MLNELAAHYQIAPATLSNWNRQFQERAAEIFRQGPSDSERQLDEKEQEIAVLQQKVKQFTVETSSKRNLTRSLAPTAPIEFVASKIKD